MARKVRWLRWFLALGALIAALSIFPLRSFQSTEVHCICSACGRRVVATQSRSWFHRSPWTVLREEESVLSKFLGFTGACPHSSSALLETGTLGIDGLHIAGTADKLVPIDMYEFHEWPGRRWSLHGTFTLEPFAPLRPQNVRDGKLLGLGREEIQTGLRKPRDQAPRWRDLEEAEADSSLAGTTTTSGI